MLLIIKKHIASLVIQEYQKIFGAQSLSCNGDIHPFISDLSGLGLFYFDLVNQGLSNISSLS